MYRKIGQTLLKYLALKVHMLLNIHKIVLNQTRLPPALSPLIWDHLTSFRNRLIPKNVTKMQIQNFLTYMEFVILDLYLDANQIFL